MLPVFADCSETLDFVLMLSMELSQIPEALIEKQLIQIAGYLLKFLMTLTIQHHLRVSIQSVDFMGLFQGLFLTLNPLFELTLVIELARQQ